MPPLKTILQRIGAFAATPGARRLVLGLFVAQALILVFSVRIGTPPDEDNHVQFIEYYAQHSLSPILTDQQPTYNLGDKTREADYLYHYGMSLVYRVLPLSPHAKQLTIRVFSLVLALLCFIVLANLFRRLGVSEGVITGSLLLLTNLPMVLLMSSAVNNDVLVWLGLSLGLWLVLRLWHQPSLVPLLWLLVLAVIGGLAKRDLLPLGLVFGLLGLVIFCRHAGRLATQPRRLNWQAVAALVVLFLSIALFTERVGGNVLHYGTVTPTCEQVQGQAACYDFWASIRNRELAVRPPEKPLPPALFVPKWFRDSSANIVDIQTQGWRHEVKPARWLTPFLLCVLGIGLLYGVAYEKRQWRTDPQAKYRVFVLALAWYYILVNLAVNYSTYLHVHVYGLALNGRYIIPSVLLLSILAGFYWSRLLARYPRVFVTFALAVVLATIFASGLLMMLRNPQFFYG